MSEHLGEIEYIGMVKFHNRGVVQAVIAISS